MACLLLLYLGGGKLRTIEGSRRLMLKHLNIDEMVALSKPWVEDAKRKALFLSIPEIAALHAKIEQVYADLLGARPAAPEVSPALRKLLDEGAQADVRHDQLARAVFAGIDADRALCLGASPPDIARASQCDEVSVKLFPNGLHIVNASLLAESGNSARVAKLLDDEPPVGAFLKAIPVRGKATLLDVTHAWIDAGAQLGKIEHAREELEAKAATKHAGKAALTNLRGRWIRLVSQVLSNLELSDAPAEAIETIRGPVLKASERAAKRYADDKDAPPPPAEEPPKESAQEESA
jgi:hypothetical protein